MSKEFSPNLTKSAAFRLWNFRYEVYLPELAMVSAKYVAQNGVGVSGDRTLDRARVNPMERVWQTVAGLAILYAEGHPFSLVKHGDSLQMYHDIQKHFQDWLEQTYYGTDPRQFPPLDDFRLLECLAVEVYSTVKAIMPMADDRSALMDRLLGMNRRRNLGATNKWIADRALDARGVLKPYESIVDKIEKYVLED
jgi:hypothetical protein